MIYEKSNRVYSILLQLMGKILLEGIMLYFEKSYFIYVTGNTYFV